MNSRGVKIGGYTADMTATNKKGKYQSGEVKHMPHLQHSWTFIIKLKNFPIDFPKYANTFVAPCACDIIKVRSINLAKAKTMHKLFPSFCGIIAIYGSFAAYRRVASASPSPHKFRPHSTLDWLEEYLINKTCANR